MSGARPRRADAQGAEEEGFRLTFEGEAAESVAIMLDQWIGTANPYGSDREEEAGGFVVRVDGEEMRMTGWDVLKSDARYDFPVITLLFRRVDPVEYEPVGDPVARSIWAIRELHVY